MNVNLQCAGLTLLSGLKLWLLPLGTCERRAVELLTYCYLPLAELEAFSTICSSTGGVWGSGFKVELCCFELKTDATPTG